ncbi:MAG: Ig domain-containing protein [Lachnospiraceae bacterium]|nr:Ig domain-containing protein [Lachnospiraceae bacterium]
MFKRIRKMIIGILLLGFGLVLNSSISYAADVAISPTEEKADAPLMQLDTQYVAYNMAGKSGYVKFITPNEVGYLTLHIINIDTTGMISKVYNASGDELYQNSAYDGVGGDCNNEFYIDNNDKHFQNDHRLYKEELLQQNTTYYINLNEYDKKIDGKYGHIKVFLEFISDKNPNGPDAAEAIELYKTYSRNIDAKYVFDYDYFKFKTTNAGTYKLFLKKFDGDLDSAMNYSIKKASNLETVKDAYGNDFDHDISIGNENTTYRDVVLEANTEYIVTVKKTRLTRYSISVEGETKVTSITVPAVKQLVGGGSFDLGAIVAPENANDKRLTYVSSNTKICEVDKNGKVTAKSRVNGVAIITATSNDGSGVKAECKVVVTHTTSNMPAATSFGKNSIKLIWFAMEGVDGWELEMLSNGKWSVIYDGKATEFNKKGLKNGGKYKFRLRGYIILDGVRYYAPYSSENYGATKLGASRITSIKKKKMLDNHYSVIYKLKIKWKKVKGANGYTILYKAPGKNGIQELGKAKGTSKTVEVIVWKTGKGISKKPGTFYVTPYIKHGYEFEGVRSKAKKYKFKYKPQ